MFSHFFSLFKHGTPTQSCSWLTGSVATIIKTLYDHKCMTLSWFSHSDWIIAYSTSYESYFIIVHIAIIILATDLIVCNCVLVPKTTILVTLI